MSMDLSYNEDAYDLEYDLDPQNDLDLHYDFGHD